MSGHGLKNQRGSVLVFTTMSLALLVIIGGIAIDLAFLSAARGEVQRSMDAAALAGAGNLGFDDSVFGTVRMEAWRFANLNPSRAGAINLNLNSGNGANGDIVLGIWDGVTFTPSFDGTRVNAVRCQYSASIPTSFLRLLGLTSLSVSAQATAISNPPQTVPPQSCVFPIALSSCGFDPQSSTGCGQAVTFITSSGSAGPLGPPGTNTAAWSNTCGTDAPTASETQRAIGAAADSDQDCSACTSGTGTEIGTNNGMQQSVFNFFEEKFIDQFNSGETYQVTDANGDTTYDGPGWKVLSPVVRTECPARAFSGPREVAGWTEFVITQVINRGTCAVNNPFDPQVATLCPDSGQPSLRAIFGYFRCTFIDSPQDHNPGERTALATKLRLAQ
jgi:hypothetical protein